MAAQKAAPVDPPKTIFEAAERGLAGYITRTVERAIEFNINIRDKYQRTALHWAAEAGQVEAAECLLDYGVDPLATECNGRTAIHLAARAGRTDVLKLLLEGRPPAEQETLVNQPDFFGLTPVFLALQRGEEAQEAFSLLMDRGGRYNQQTPTGKFLPTNDPADQPVRAGEHPAPAATPYDPTCDGLGGWQAGTDAALMARQRGHLHRCRCRFMPRQMHQAWCR